MTFISLDVRPQV